MKKRSAVCEPKVRIVTPEQYQQGYMELRGMFIYARSFAPIRRLSDGNWLVHEPEQHAQT